MLEMHGISKRFDSVVALKDASLQAEEGKIVALLGANGSGKSTMVKILAGLLKPDSGDIFLDGKKIIIRSSYDAIAHGITTAFQDLSLIPTMSVMDNLLLGSESVTQSGFIDRKKDLDIVEKILEKFHLNCSPTDYVQTLMPSTQSMLEVAKAVFKKPRFLLLDEVTAAMHHDEIEVLHNIMRELCAEGVGIVYVTHRMKEIMQICQCAQIMRNGESVVKLEQNELNLDDIVFHMTGKRPERMSSENDNNFVPSEIGTDTVLEVQNLQMLPRVKDISLHANRGEIVGIAGLDGQGQSEFIRMILGAQKRDSGLIKLQGKEVFFRSPSDAVKNSIGFISGERNRESVFSIRSIAENIFVGMTANGGLIKFIGNKEMNKFSGDIVEKYNIKIGEMADPISSLSGGNQQKVILARWIGVMPTLLLLDDPTKGVDAHSRVEIHVILKDCARSGMTVIVSSSDNDELLAVADRIYVFYEGNIRAELEGTGKTSERLVAAMMGLNESEAFSASPRKRRDGGQHEKMV